MKVFSTLDLYNGYWQVEVDKDSIEKTAFSTPDGHWECLRMSFVLANAPSTFLRLMTEVLDGLLNKICQLFLDDVFLYSKTPREHLEALRSIFHRLRKANLKLKTKKFKLFREKVKYLGHIVSSLGIAPDPDKINSVLRFPQPITVLEILIFLGLVGFYRKFIEKYAHYARHLTYLTKQNIEFSWNTEQEVAFQYLKGALVSAPVLRIPDFTLVFILYTDASSYALGGVLSQIFPDGEHSIAYASFQLKKAEKNYSANELECYAVVRMVRHFRVYLLGRHFVIYTDHKPLKWLLTLKKPKPRLAMWIMDLSEYDYEVSYQPGPLLNITIKFYVR
jgi:hypothetical protein